MKKTKFKNLSQEKKALIYCAWHNGLICESKILKQHNLTKSQLWLIIKEVQNLLNGN